MRCAPAEDNIFSIKVRIQRPCGQIGVQTPRPYVALPLDQSTI